MLTATLDDYCGSSWDYDRVYHHQDSGLLFSEYFQEGGGKPSDFVEFYTNDNLYSVAYYYLDRP